MKIELSNKVANLIGLSNIRKYDIDHADQHPVLGGMSGIFDDRNHIGSLLCHVHQIPTTSMRKLHSINHTSLNTQTKIRIQTHSLNIIKTQRPQIHRDQVVSTYRSNNVRHVRDSGSRSSTKVQNSRTRFL